MKTSYSRHELYALGEPLGDGATRKEAGRVIYGGGGGGGPTYTESKVTNSNIPEYAQPYVENMLGAAQKQVYQADGTTFQPYKAYGGTYDAAGNQTSYDPSKGIAGFQPMQQQAQAGIQNLQLPGQFNTAMIGTQNAANSLFNTAGEAGGYGAQGFGAGMQGMGYGMQAANAGNQYAQQATNPNAIQAYMSPYMQNVVDIQKREAGRQSAIQGTQQQAQATQAGAFGGGRDAIMRAERERNLGQQMGDIQAQGSQNAFQQAQQAQQFGANLGLQGMQTGIQGAQAGMQGAQTGLQGVSAQQAGYGQAMQGANQLANIANQQLQAQQGIYGLQNQVGGQQQALEQAKLNQAQQDYANAQQYPMMQLGSLSNMLRGLPMQATSTQQYQAQPNALTQGIGAAGSMASLYNAYNTPSKAEGGAIKSMASGGITSIPRYDVGGQVMSQLEQMDDRALENEAKTSPSPRIREMAQAILKQRQAGMDTAPQMDMAPQPQQGMGMAGGGIIAFADGKKVPKPNYSEDVTGSILAENADIDAMIQANAQKRAALGVDDRSARDPSLYRTEVPPSPYAENENLPLGQRITNTLDRIRSRTDPAFVPRSAAAPSNTAAVLNENEFPPAGITAAAPKATRLSPRAAEFAAARNFKAPTKTGGDYISEDEFFANKPASSAETSYTGTKLSPESLKTLEAQAAEGKRGYADMLQAYYKKFPQAVASESGIKQISAADFDAARKLTSESTSITPADKAAITATQVDPFASTKDALAKANAEAGKTKKELYDEDLEAKKALGLDQNEAQQAYMKRIMGQQSNIAADAEQKKYLRLAEFFASWGSTPGDTLVAGMKAVKEKIPDMIADVKERRKAEAEADKILYELGQAVRQEKLGNWDKAEIKKTKLAESAAKLQETLTTAQTSYAVAGVNKTGSIEAAKIVERSHNYTADKHLEAQKISSAATESVRKEATTSRERSDQLRGLDLERTGLDNLYKSLEATKLKDKRYLDAVATIKLADSMPSDASEFPEYQRKKREAEKVIEQEDNKVLKVMANRFAAHENRIKEVIPSYVSVGNPYDTNMSASTPTTQTEFDKTWATLKSGQSLTGPDGKTYTKK